MMPRPTLCMLPLSAAVFLLAASSGQCCVSTSSASVLPTTDAAAAATPAKAPEAKPATKVPTRRFDMDMLVEHLKQTQAIGMLTKLVLRANVNDLIDEVKYYKRHQGTQKQLERIKAHFNGLLLKVLALLADDPKLAEDIQCARDNLWHHLMEVKA